MTDEIIQPVEARTPEVPLAERTPEDELELLLAAERKRRRRGLRISPRRQAIMLLLAFSLGLGSGFLMWGRSPEVLAQRAGRDRSELAAQVTPEEGFELPVIYGDIGPQMVAAGAIDAKQFVALYERNGRPLNDEQMQILRETATGRVRIDKNNSYFLLNFFWALGLVNKNALLETGPMVERGRDQVGNFASTGGWTLGAKPATELYSSAEIIRLTDEQQARMEEVAKGAYRPCCGNPTSFPDCNHGMALLGLLELMASQDASVDEMFLAAKQVNAFWFPDQMLKLATYFSEVEGQSFETVDPRRVVSAEFFSGNGFQKAHEALAERGLLPESPSQGQSCGV